MFATYLKQVEINIMKMNLRIKRRLFCILICILSSSAFSGSLKKSSCRDSFSKPDAEQLQISYDEIIQFILDANIRGKRDFLVFLKTEDWPEHYPKSPHKVYSEWRWEDLERIDQSEQERESAPLSSSIITGLEQEADGDYTDMDDFLEVLDKPE